MLWYSCVSVKHSQRKQAGGSGAEPPRKFLGQKKQKIGVSLPFSRHFPTDFRPFFALLSPYFFHHFFHISSIPSSLSDYSGLLGTAIGQPLSGRFHHFPSRHLAYPALAAHPLHALSVCVFVCVFVRLCASLCASLCAVLCASLRVLYASLCAVLCASLCASLRASLRVFVCVFVCRLVCIVIDLNRLLTHTQRELKIGATSKSAPNVPITWNIQEISRMSTSHL